MGDCNAAQNTESSGSCISLKGTSKGFEIQIERGAGLASVVSDIRAKLAEAPGFFKGGDVTLRFQETPPRGCLGVIEELTDQYGLRIVGVHGPSKEPDNEPDAKVSPIVAAGSEPIASGRRVASSAPVQIAAPTAELTTKGFVPPPLPPPLPRPKAAVAAVAAVSQAANGTLPPKMVVGPVRSGCILEFAGHLIVLGDVNPGAEIRASGSIVILGRLRGIAHAGCGGGSGFILALQMEPQQLRIASVVARPGDSDESPDKAEIAYVKDGGMIVDQYKGRVPFGIETAKF
ncbi:MAG: septum site-determining protein MinC [Kofleriaceae bacterium]|nr:septum site-determining protein MinC [Kofleriaceae bacterium]